MTRVLSLGARIGRVNFCTLFLSLTCSAVTDGFPFTERKKGIYIFVKPHVHPNMSLCILEWKTGRLALSDWWTQWSDTWVLHWWRSNGNRSSQHTRQLSYFFDRMSVWLSIWSKVILVSTWVMLWVKVKSGQFRQRFMPLWTCRYEITRLKSRDFCFGNVFGNYSSVPEPLTNLRTMQCLYGRNGVRSPWRSKASTYQLRSTRCPRILAAVHGRRRREQWVYVHIQEQYKTYHPASFSNNHKGSIQP